MSETAYLVAFWREPPIDACTECQDDISAAARRGVDPGLLYAYACSDHARLIRCRIDSEYAEWVRRELERLTALCTRLENACDARSRIDKGKRMLDDPTLTLSQINKYQKRVKELESSVPADFVNLDTKALQGWLARTQTYVLELKTAFSGTEVGVV